MDKLKATDLRIGNYISYRNVMCTVADVLCDSVNTKLNEGILYADIQPIPLSEVLVLFGLERFDIKNDLATEGWRFSKHLELQNVGAGYYRLYKPTAYARGAENTHIKYAHELQNLIYILTGTEVTFKQ